MVTAAKMVQKHRPDTRFLVSAADAIPVERIETALASQKETGLFRLVCGSPRQIFEQADMLIAASGTITLEAALWKIPTLIVYKMSPVSFKIAQIVVKVKFAGLANLIAGRQVMPELLQTQASSQNICATALDMLDNLPEYSRKLALVRQMLGPAGAAARAAKIALDLLGRTNADDRTSLCLTNTTKPY